MNAHESSSAKSAGTIQLGGELTVNRLGYGAMRITGAGIWGPPKDRNAALAVLRRLPELGVNFVDTADSYGPDISEQLIAEALYPYPAGFVVATKGGWERTGPGQWTHNASQSHLRKAVEASLKKLRVECIDLYQLHIPDPLISFEASLAVLTDLQSQGKIRLIGLSNVTQEHVERASKVANIVSVQNRYSFADREWDYLVDYCDKKKIAFIPWAPLVAGKAANDAANKVAKAHSATPLQVALAWLLRRSPMMLPIPGTSSVQHLEENMRAASLKLSKEEFNELAGVEEVVFSR
jgi:pyridoxine 4-dehydrogenase